MSFPPKKSNLLLRIFNFEANSFQDRQENFKKTKDILKDFFDVIKNIIITATFQVAAKETKNIFINSISILMFGALTMYVVTSVMQRINFGPKPGETFGLKGWSLMLSIGILFSFVQMQIVKLIAEIVISKSH